MSNYYKLGVPLQGGGDTHFHPFGDKFVVTTRLPGGIDIHDDIVW